MKKSFLDRALAAAIAVPVALSQTVLFTSFADGEPSVSNTTTFNVDTFVSVPVSNEVSPITEVEKYSIYTQDSIWNTKVAGGINAVNGTKIDLDVAPIVEAAKQINDKGFADILKNAVAGNVQIVGTDVVVTLDAAVSDAKQDEIKGDIVSQILKASSNVEESVVNENVTLDTLKNAKIQVVITADASKLSNGKEVGLTVKVSTYDASTGKYTVAKTVDDVFKYGDATLDSLGTELKAGCGEVIKHYEGVVEDNQGKKDAAQTTKDNAQTDLNTKKTELADAQTELNEKKAQLEEVKTNGGDVTKAEKEVADAQTKLDNAKAQADAAQKTLDDAQAKLDDAQAQLDEAKAQLEEAKGQLENEIDKRVASYKDQLKNMQNKADKILSKNETATFEGATYNDVLTSFKNKYSQNSYVKKVPGTVSGIFSDETVSGVYNEAIKQLNAGLAANDNPVVFDVALTDVSAIAESATNVTLTAGVGEGTVTEFATKADLPDELSESDIAYYVSYFNELLAEETDPQYADKEVDTVTTKKVMTMSYDNSTADDAMFAGTGKYDVERIITITLKDKETSETEESTEESTEPSESENPSESTEPSESENPSESTEPSESENPSESTEPSESENPSESTEPSESENPSESTEPSDSTEESNPTIVKDMELTVAGDVATNRNFYFAHDVRPFIDADLINDLIPEAKIVTTVNGVEAKEDADMTKFAFAVPGQAYDLKLSAKQVFSDAIEAAKAANPENWKDDYDFQKPYALDIYYDMDGEGYAKLKAQVYIYIGVKGDANLDGDAAADDGAVVLQYAAAAGSGNEAALTDDVTAAKEAFAWFLADVDSESKDMGATSNNADVATAALAADDAAYILVYAAQSGSGNNPDWGTTVLQELSSLPKYTKEISDWVKANPQNAQ